MKPTFKYLIICLFALFCFNSCQDETVQETESPEESIAPNSTVANLVRLTVANDGSVDNVMDNANCFSINLPVTIIVNGITITISTLDDLELIEDIFDEYENDEDILEFLFPITIILNDYEEIVIENEEQLEDFIEECTEQEEDDDIIECVDFVYPISFSIYNADFQLIDTVEITSDQALYEFLDSLEDNPNGAVIASLNYPVSLIYADGSTVEVNSNQELEAAINAAEDECDDDNDDECDLNLQDIEEYLLACSVSAHFSNENELDELDFEFIEDGVLIVNGEPAVTETASWELSETDEGYVLTIEGLQTFDIANGNWLLEDCDEDDDWLDLEFTQLVNNETITMELEVDCDEEEEDCNEEDVAMYLLECHWYSGSDLMNNDNNGPYYFYENNVVEIISPAGNPVPVTGTWDIATTDDGVIIVLTLPEPYNAISDITWLVVECEEDRIEMISGDNHLVFERDCEENEFDCEALQANVGDECENANGVVGFINEDCECEVEEEDYFECFGDYDLSVCDEEDGVLDGLGLFDLNLIFSNCPNDDVAYNFYETLVDAEEEVNPLPSLYTNAANPQAIYSRVYLAGDPNVFEIFTHTLIVEDCTSFDCFENIELTYCDDTEPYSDGIMDLDLTEVYAECESNNNDVVVTYHETLTEAESSVNALASPYTNTVAFSQTLYARVEAITNSSVFEIYEVNIIIEDCTQEACNEAEVDAHLVECIWNITNFNGDDHLIEWNLDFESNSNIVVIYTDETTIDATWSTYQSSNGAVVIFSGVNGADIQAITGEWLVVECGDGVLQLENFENDDIMVMEQNCN